MEDVLSFLVGINVVVKVIDLIRKIGEPKPLTSSFLIMFMYDKQEEIKKIIEEGNRETQKTLLSDAFSKYLLTKDKLNEIKKDLKDKK